MTRIFSLFFSLILTLTSFAQLKTDTLFIGNKKYPLKKASVYYLYETGDVSLPSEYQEITSYSNNKTVNYKELTDSTDYYEFLDDGTEIRVRKPRNKQLEKRDVNLFCFIDTLKITYKEFSNFKLYIKSNNHKTFFSACKVNYLYKDTLGEVTYRKILDGNMFRYFYSYSPISDTELTKLKQTTFILKGLFYVRKNATYYLDREFIIVIK